MLGIDTVTYTFATVTCDWPGCSNRINMQPGPEDIGREQRDLRVLQNLAKRQGWTLEDDRVAARCSYHNRKEQK